MSGTHAPHLQRRNGIYHLRMRVPDRLRPRIERMEISRSLKTYSSVIARRLAAKVSAQVQETFVVIEKKNEISPAEAREMIQFCFAELKHRTDQNCPFVPTSDYPDLEILEQEALTDDRVNDLRRQMMMSNFEPMVSRLASEYLMSQGIQLEGLQEQEKLKLMHGFAQALEESQRYFLHRLQNPISVYQPQNELFDTQGRSTQLENFYPSPVTATGPSVAQAVADYLAASEQLTNGIEDHNPPIGIWKHFLTVRLPPLILRITGGQLSTSGVFPDRVRTHLPTKSNFWNVSFIP